jgi:hypothetical protein
LIDKGNRVAQNGGGGGGIKSKITSQRFSMNPTSSYIPTVKKNIIPIYQGTKIDTRRSINNLNKGVG